MAKNKIKTPRIIHVISILTLLTITRIQAGLFLPTLEMYGGESSNVWLTPWITDTILGLLLPFIVWTILKGKGAKTWAILIVYSTIGAFDYIHGIIAQWQHPLPTELASNELVFGSLITTLIFQLAVIFLLFKNKVLEHFLSN